MSSARPSWIPDHVPALDGVRGLAVLLVLLHHCEPRLRSLGLAGFAAWGWTGVDLFFVLSGYLITGIIVDQRGDPRFFRNFYARRALRIWPVYALVVVVNVVVFGRANTWNGTGPFGLYLALFIYNLMPGLTGTLYPAWSLAIEEQFYLVWAPVARRLRPQTLAWMLAAVLAAEPWLRRHLGAPEPIHTLYHLDGLAVGALLALGLRGLGWSRPAWARLGALALGLGALGLWAASRWQGAALDSAVALLFGGLVLLSLAHRPAARPLAARPMRALGRISYSLYLTHMLVFAFIGALDEHMDRVHAGAPGDLVIVAVRWTLAIAVATLVYRFYERPVLRLKRRFQPVPASPAAAPAPALPAG